MTAAPISRDEVLGRVGHGLLLLPTRSAPVLILDCRSYRKDMVFIDEVRADSDVSEALTTPA